MGKLVDAIASSAAPLVWLDSDAYASRLFASPPPWLDVTGLIGWRRKAQGLLRSDVITLPVDAVCSAWLDANVTLAQEMLLKKRNLFPLKTLLADAALRAYLDELARAMQQSFGGLPFALAVPSPRAWVGVARAAVNDPDESIEVDDDDADSAAVYVADFLRTFADCRVDALLLDETGTTQPVSAESLSPYQAALNVAGHYRWDCGVKLAGPAGGALASTGLSFAIAPVACDIATGISAGNAFWSGQLPLSLSRNGFRYADMPTTMAPEDALESLAALRAANRGINDV